MSGTGQDSSSFYVDGGILVVQNGGTATSDTFAGGGTGEIQAGGFAFTATVQPGGVLTIDNGGTVNGVLVQGSGELALVGAAPAFTNVIINAFGILDVGAGFTLDVSAFGTDIAFANGGSIAVENTGVTTNLVISSGTLEVVSAGGEADGTSVGPGGTLKALGGATIATAEVSAGGTFAVGNGFTLDSNTDVTLDTGALVDVLAGGTLHVDLGFDLAGLTTTVEAGGIFQVGSGFTYDESTNTSISLVDGAVVSALANGVVSNPAGLVGHRPQRAERRRRQRHHGRRRRLRVRLGRRQQRFGPGRQRRPYVRRRLRRRRRQRHRRLERRLCAV